MTTSEKATQKSMTLPTRSVHQTSFLWALCHELVLSTPISWWPKTAPACPSPRSPTSAPVPPDARGSDASRSRRGRGGRSPPRAAPPAPRTSPPGWGHQQRRVVAALAGALTAPSGLPSASTAIEHLSVFLGIEQAHSKSFSPSYLAPTNYR